MFGGGRRRGGPQRGADLRYDLEIKFEAGGAAASRPTIQIPAPRDLRHLQGQRRRGRHPARRTCPQCRGAGQLRYQQGFFTVARTCAQCRGAGKVDRQAVPDCHGAGPRAAATAS